MPKGGRESSNARGIASEFELVPRSEEDSFAVREFKLPAFPSPWHFHPECELTYILGSRGTRFVGDNISPYEPGELVLLGSNMPHCWRNDTSGRGGRCLAHSLVIQFGEDCLGEGFLDRPELAGVRELLQKARRGLQFTGAKTREAVIAIMMNIKRHSGLARVVGLLEIFKILVEADACRVLSSEGFVPFLDKQAGERIGRVCKYVLANLPEKLDFARIAGESCMSQSALCHYFKRVTGRTLSEFINELRIGHARRLLIESSDGIAQIAYASGFGSLSNFNRRFQELGGLSPSEYRAKYQIAGTAAPGNSPSRAGR
jgi:AraC-like DNA-binding protein/quercetin dioxygenase-like cupin family protein